MEFLSGGSLVDYVATNLGSIPDVIMFRIAIGMARGLADLAKQNIVHRDLAARNILLDASMEPKISDFGFSRMVAGGSAEGQTASNIGPVRWMAPVRVFGFFWFFFIGVDLANIVIHFCSRNV
jgi:serine/threonine protein kinase